MMLPGCWRVSPATWARWPGPGWISLSGRSGRDSCGRSLLVVSVLAALGRGEELDIHVPAALRHGVTKTELEEVMLTVFAYAGAPLAVEGIRKVIEHTGGGGTNE